MIIGAHVPDQEPLQEAKSVGAECIQLFAGPPQSWKKPPPREDADALLKSPLPIYVHAPYLINVASPNNRIRIPSRKMLSQHLRAAHAFGAQGLIVHAGHSEDGIEQGFERWRKALEEVRDSPVPVLIENTAGGDNAMGRFVEVLARLWEVVGDLKPGFCFDTCHAHAAGEDLSDVVPRVLAAVGKIDLVHCNDSRDLPGTGADRHTNFATGNMDEDTILDMVRAAKAPAVICETPWPGIADDMEILHTKL